MAASCSYNTQHGCTVDGNEQRRRCTAFITPNRGGVHAAVWARPHGLLELARCAADLGEAGAPVSCKVEAEDDPGLGERGCCVLWDGGRR